MIVSTFGPRGSERKVLTVMLQAASAIWHAWDISGEVEFVKQVYDAFVHAAFRCASCCATGGVEGSSGPFPVSATGIISGGDSASESEDWNGFCVVSSHSPNKSFRLIGLPFTYR
jgi:hypothetical protein